MEVIAIGLIALLFIIIIYLINEIDKIKKKKEIIKEVEKVVEKEVKVEVEKPNMISIDDCTELINTIVKSVVDELFNKIEGINNVDRE